MSKPELLPIDELIETTERFIEETKGSISCASSDNAKCNNELSLDYLVNILKILRQQNRRIFALAVDTEDHDDIEKIIVFQIDETDIPSQYCLYEVFRDYMKINMPKRAYEAFEVENVITEPVFDE